MKKFDLVPITQNAISWFNDQLQGSGISQDVADYAGIVLRPTHYEIPYYDINDNPTGIIQARSKPDDNEVDDYTKSDSRYYRLKGVGLGAAPYWPRWIGLNHSKALCESLDHSLWVVEGEKKALCLQGELFRQGIPGSVVAMGGISHVKAIMESVERVPFTASSAGTTFHRNVIIALDWAKEDMNPEVLRSESKLYTAFEDRGAQVTILRWDTESTDEQKIDDWLVAGGELAKALEFSQQQEYAPQPELQAKLEEFNDKYAVLDGKIVPLASPEVEFSKSQFLIETAPHFELIQGSRSVRKVPVADIWLEWPRRRHVDGRIFAPCPVGSQPEPLVNNRLNIARPWPNSNGAGDWGPWVAHLGRFCETPAQLLWLQQHIAHAMRYPAQVTSNAVALADAGGTGKGLMMQTLRRVFGTLFVDLKDELTGRFNAELAGKLIAYYDEPDGDRWNADSLERNTKRLVGNPTIKVEGKGTRAYTIENYVRLFVSLNMDYVTRITQTDRRWNYFGGTRMTHEEAVLYVEWMNSDNMIGAMWEWAAQVDLSAFNPQVLGPMTDIKAKAMTASQTIYEEFLEWDELEGDIWATGRLYEAFRIFAPGSKVTPTRFGREMSKLLPDELCKRTVKVRGNTCRLRCVRNVAQWTQADNAAWSTIAKV